MDSSIIQCIQIRKDFFEKYYSVPDEMQSEVNAFIGELYSIGEQSNDAQEFETKFAAHNLQERFNAILMRCTPKPYNMSKEEKAVSKDIAKEIFTEDRPRIIKEEVEEALDYTTVMAEEKVAEQRRKAMIEMGVYDEYTRVTNKIEMLKDAGGLLKNLFKKKK